jgi:hypothetical protein
MTDNEFHQQLLTAKFPMGKHRGESLARVVDEDINYCIWVIQQGWFQNRYPDLMGIMLRSLKQVAEEN